MLEPVASKFRSSLSNLLFSGSYQMIFNDRGNFIFALLKTLCQLKNTAFKRGAEGPATIRHTHESASADHGCQGVMKALERGWKHEGEGIVTSIGC